MQNTAQKQEQITGPQSMVLLKNMLRLSLSSICYQRGIFPPELFSKRDYAGVSVHQLESAEKGSNGQIKVRHTEAFLLTQWLEKGVFHALEQSYLRTLTFAVYTKYPLKTEDVLLETYQFHVTYPTEKGGPHLNGSPITKDNLKKQAVSFIRSLVEFSATLESLPDDRWLTIQIKYYDDVTPHNYEPEFFKAAKQSEMLKFFKQPMKVKISSISTPYNRMDLKFAGIESIMDEEITGEHSHSNAPNIQSVKSTLQAHASYISQSQNLATQTNQGDHTEKAIESTPDPRLYEKVKSYIMKTGNAQFQDCTQEMTNMDPDVEKYEVKEVFNTLVEENFLKKTGRRYSINLSVARPTMKLSLEEVGSTKRKLGYSQEEQLTSKEMRMNEDDSDKYEHTQISPVNKSVYELSQDEGNKMSTIREPIHQFTFR